MTFVKYNCPQDMRVTSTSDWDTVLESPDSYTLRKRGRHVVILHYCRKEKKYSMYCIDHIILLIYCVVCEYSHSILPYEFILPIILVYYFRMRGAFMFAHFFNM